MRAGMTYNALHLVSVRFYITGCKQGLWEVLFTSIFIKIKGADYLWKMFMVKMVC